MALVTKLAVNGMTCGHCVSAVTSELEKISEVENVSVELRKDQPSVVTIVSDYPLDVTVLSASIEEAGYELKSVSVAK